MTVTPAAERLDQAHVTDIVDVLCSAFARYPVMRFVLGTSAAESASPELRRLIEFFVRTRVLREEPLLGVRDGTLLAAAALVSRPAVSANSPVQSSLRAAIWQELGEAARSRYEIYTDACSSFAVDAPHIHVNMIGVRRSYRGSGFGRRLLAEVDRLALEEEACDGITLTTEDPANVAFYERLGYRTIGHVVIAPELESWGFFRHVRQNSP